MIEFGCPHCDKRLKTSDDKAGRQAKCPGCGELIDVPEIVKKPDDVLAVDAEERPEPDSDDQQSDDQFSDATKQCPMCGQTIKAAAIRCRFCREYLEDSEAAGERLSDRREMRPFPPGEVISEAWRIFVDKMGLLIGTFLVQTLLILAGMALAVIPMAIADQLGAQDNQAMALVALCASGIIFLFSMVFAIYLQAGYAILQVKVAREQPAQLSDLFSGGRFFWRMLLNSLLFSLIVGLGSMACIVPGIFLAVMFFPFAYVLVDEDLPGIECLGRAKELTDGNWGSIFLVFIVGWIATCAGAAACYVGLFFAIPFVNLMYAVEYDRMTCQTRIGSRDEATA